MQNRNGMTVLILAALLAVTLIGCAEVKERKADRSDLAAREVAQAPKKSEGGPGAEWNPPSEVPEEADSRPVHPVIP